MNFSVSLSESFVMTLARHILAKSARNPQMTAKMLVLLPSRRACRSLREACLEASGGKPMLLPRMMPIGEISDEADFSRFFDMQDDDALPVIDSKKRKALLMRLIRRFEPTPVAKAYKLAGALSDLLDDVTRHQLDFSKLESLVPSENLAKHWQHSLRFLALITQHWPRILAEEGLQDCTQASNQRLLSLAQVWKKTPPDFTVIAAGSTGSIPAVAELLAVISQMPQGEVILPGLDRAMSDKAWECLDATHPQYTLKQLLKKMNVRRKDVALLEVGEHGGNECLRAMFTPAELTAGWSDIALNVADDMRHIELLEAATQLDEARMIALLMREALDVPEKTVALVTPDRALARKVVAQLKRYDITIDDSAGTPLSLMPAPVFMRLIMDVIASDYSPVSLLALLRHPLASAGLNTAKTREYSRLLEHKILRGIRFDAGMDSIIAEAKYKTLSDDFIAWLSNIRDALTPLHLLWLNNQPVELNLLIRTHISVAELLADSESLWGHDSGNQLATMLSEWMLQSDALGALSAHEYPAWVENIMAAEIYRPRYSLHPRLHILSPMEARMVHVDMVILAELNETVWPAQLAADPWMSLPMREAFGLPPAGFSIGQSAHDMWILLHTKQVVLTRAKKIAGTPTIASRWWVRLKSLVEGKSPAVFLQMNQSEKYESCIRAQDALIAQLAAKKPSPIPPNDAKPRRFSVSDIDGFEDDKYAYYARKILGLYELESLDKEPDSAAFGEMIHAVLERFVAQHPHDLPEHAYQKILLDAKAVMADLWERPAVKSLWWPRVEAIVRDFLETEKILRAQSFDSHCELKTVYKFTVGDESVELVARADRVDISEHGARLIDYKTGKSPSAKAIKDGAAKQLPLTALALMKGDKADLLSRTAIDELIYWPLKGRDEEGELVSVPAADLLARAQEQMEQLIAYIYHADTAFEPSAQANLYDDYEHLSRKKEWGGS